MSQQPTTGAVHHDVLLTQISIGYRNLEYIADRIFPIVEVNKQSDLIPEFDQSYWFRDEAKPRLPGTRSERGGFKVRADQTYFAARHSFGYELDDDTRKNSDQVWQLETNAVEFVTDKTQLRRERAFAADFMQTSVWGQDKTGGTDFTKWSDYAGSSPLLDLDEWRDSVEARIGREANKFVIGKQTWLKLKWHPDLIDTIKYTQRGQMTLQLFQALAEIDEVLIGRALYTSDAEGTSESSVSYSRIWGKDGLLLYVPPRPSLMTPAAGYTFVWNVVPGAIQYIKRMRDEEREVDIFEANSYFDQKVVGTRAGVFLDELVA